jgi:hypothetical protein
MAGLQAPLSMLRHAPRDALRMTRGPVWCAIPFPVRDFSGPYSLPISRRTNVRKFPFPEPTRRTARKINRLKGIVANTSQPTLLGDPPLTLFIFQGSLDTFHRGLATSREFDELTTVISWDEDAQTLQAVLSDV